MFKKINFEIETITPMFLAGADGKTAELRPPSIKGMMRFWWRALNGHLSRKDLKEAEAKIFGSSGEEIGRSSFSIRLFSTVLNCGDFSPVPHSDTKKFKFSGLKPHQSFTMSFISQSGSNIVDLFKIASMLGGFGKRSRRGFGSIRIAKIDNNMFVQGYELDMFCNLLNSVVNNAFEVNNNKIQRNITAHIESDYPYIKTIEIGESCENSDALLKAIGTASHSNDCDYTGFAIGKKRFASPIYVSIIKDNGKYRPIITTLNTAFEPGHDAANEDKSKNFISDILNAGGSARA